MTDDESNDGDGDDASLSYPAFYAFYVRIFAAAAARNPFVSRRKLTPVMICMTRTESERRRRMSSSTMAVDCC